MPNKVFFNFLFLLIFRHRSKHIAIFIISTLVVILFSSVMLLSHAIEQDAQASLSAQPDFIIQKMHAGRAVETPVEWLDELSEIEGVSSALPRVYGSYFYTPNAEYFTLVGIDLFDRQISESLERLVKDLDVKDFLAQPSMIIGSGVKTHLDKFYYKEHYTFRTPAREKREVSIYDSLLSETNIVSSDMILMEESLARDILGVDEELSTDLVLYVPNELEHDNVKEKIILLFNNIRVIEKEELSTAYAQMFNYKGGLFLLLYMVVLMTFILILYQRYSMISSSDKKEIGILRALGWSVNMVIRLKIMESLIVGLSAFVLGILLAYGYVFYLDAPLLSEIFLGNANLSNKITFNHSVDFGLLTLLFLFFMAPYISAVLIPVWRIAITDPLEAMK